MKRTRHVMTIALLAACVVAGSASALELGQYSRAAERFTLGFTRGLTLSNDEVEATLTESLDVGLDLASDRLRLTVPFGQHDVDTRGGADDLLPIGRLHVRTVGAILTLDPGDRGGPFLGVGGSFYSFEEAFGSTAANIHNSFAGEATAGLRFALIDDILELASLSGAVTYQFSLLRPRVSLPNRPEIDRIRLDRHSVYIGIQLTGL